MQVTKATMDKLQKNQSVRSTRNITFKDDEINYEDIEDVFVKNEDETESQKVVAKKESKKACKCPEKAGSSKTWGVGIASFCLPGLGQFVNGESAKGLQFLASGLIANVVGNNLVDKNKSKAGLLAFAISFGIRIASIIDAVKNVRPDAKNNCCECCD